MFMLASFVYLHLLSRHSPEVAEFWSSANSIILFALKNEVFFFVCANLYVINKIRIMLPTKGIFILLIATKFLVVQEK